MRRHGGASHVATPSANKNGNWGGKMRNLWALSFAAALAGCAFSTQAPIVVKPELVAAPDSIGAGKAVYVNVVDERPNQTLGTRGVKGVGSELTVADLVDSLRNSVSQGLKNRGYSPVSAPAADGRELKVEIRDLEYNVMMGLWAGKLRAQCALQGICMIGQTRPVEKLFRGEHTESVQVVQGADANTHYVNDAISKAVNALVYDAELGKCLSSGGP